MRRIKTEAVFKDRINQFQQKLLAGIFKTGAISRLETIRDDPDKAAKYRLSPAEVFNYTENIISNFDLLFTAHTDDMPRWLAHFENIIHSDTVAADDRFYKAIVQALGYRQMQGQHMPPLLYELNIRTCVYCHAQSTLVIKKEDEDGHTIYRSLLQLDHRYAKSKYPFLSVSFYNLYPICSNCNLSKSDNDSDFSFYINTDELDLVQFKLNTQSILRYWKRRDINELEIEIVPTAEDIAFDPYKSMFRIKEIYDLHKDLVVELLDKQLVYDKAYNAKLIQNFRKLFPDESMINRLLIGNYDQPQDMLLRPLAKFTQEIARDIKLIPQLVKKS